MLLYTRKNAKHIFDANTKYNAIFPYNYAISNIIVFDTNFDFILIYNSIIQYMTLMNIIEYNDIRFDMHIII